MATRTSSTRKATRCLSRVRLEHSTTSRSTRPATRGSSAATGRSGSTRDPATTAPDNLLTPEGRRAHRPRRAADGELSCDGVNEDGTPEEGCEDDGDTLNDFIHHNSWRPDADQFKSRKAKRPEEKGVRPGETVLITEEDIWSRASQGTTKGGCETQGSFQTWQVKQLKATGEDESTVKPLDSYTTEFNEADRGRRRRGDGPDPDERLLLVALLRRARRPGRDRWYEQGTRLLDVRDPKNIKEVGYFMAPDSVVWASYFSRTDPSVIYVMDHQRGIDVLRVTPSAQAGKKVRARAVPRWFRAGKRSRVRRSVPLAHQHPRFGYVCRVR